MDTIIYVRWSSAEQTKGDSRERQLGVCRAHAKQRGWNVIREVIEEGQSAFTGVHRRSGKLGELQREIEDDGFLGGLVLLTERLDRLSREAPGQFFLWLSGITAKGVTVATVDGNRSYAGALDMASIIEIIVKASLANDESVAKSDRVASAWASKRARLASGDLRVMTRRAPGWLTVSEDGQAFNLHPERASTIKRIFEETVEGAGKHTIARRLNEEGIPTFGKSEAWHASYIQKVLNTASVLGDFQPGMKPRGSQRRLVDSPVKNYYPAVIDADLYYKARESMKARSRKSSGRGRRIANLFSGLGRCDVCGGKMTLRSKGVKTRADGRKVFEDYLVCDNMQRGIIRDTGTKCHNNVRYNYAAVEKGVLEAILSEAMDDTHFAKNSIARELANALAEANMEMDRLTRKIKFTLDNIGDDDDDAEAQTSYSKAKADRKVTRKIVFDLSEKLSVARGKASPEEHAARIAAIWSDMESADEESRIRARTSVRLAIGELVESMTFHRKGRRIGLRLLSGVRTVVVNAKDGQVALDLMSLGSPAIDSGLSERQERARARVLKGNLSRRESRPPIE